MVVVNKIVGAFLNPIALTLLLIAVAFVTSFKWRKISATALVVAFAWLWLCATPFFCNVLRSQIELDYEEQVAEDAPLADAIVILGGGMSADTNRFRYAEINSSGDRVWHAARLYKAGKAPIVVPTGNNDFASTVPFLMDLGVPQEAIKGEYAARNTEENARLVQKLLGEGKRILLVTSVWHMRRSELMFKKYAPGLQIIPAPTDFEVRMSAGKPFDWKSLLPEKDVFPYTCALFKELIGYYGYVLFRR